jgi:hypothetical protein
MSDFYLRLARTKTGTRVHLAGSGSSRTVCGAKVAAGVHHVSDAATFCAACGLDPAATPAEVRRQFPTKRDRGLTS